MIACRRADTSAAAGRFGRPRAVITALQPAATTGSEYLIYNTQNLILPGSKTNSLFVRAKGGLTFSGNWSSAVNDAVELNNCIGIQLKLKQK